MHVVDHDPEWADLAERFAGEVENLFGGWLTTGVVHVGSTAVPGLAAKPIIDLQAVSADPAAALAAVGDAAAAIGWMFVPRDLDQRAWRWLFVRTSSDAWSRLAHLHPMPPGQGRWHDQLIFRDRLRSSPQLRAEYVQVKQHAAAKHPDDRDTYGRAKPEFVLRVVAGKGLRRREGPAPVRVVREARDRPPAAEIAGDGGPGDPRDRRVDHGRRLSQREARMPIIAVRMLRPLLSRRSWPAGR